MAKRFALLLLATCLWAQPAPQGRTNQFPHRFGLALVGVATDGLALAADGAQHNADGTTSEVQKIFQVGKSGAILLAGEISSQDPVTRPVREEFNASRVTQLWLSANASASFDNVQQELTATILRLGTKYFSQRQPTTQSATYKFALVFVNYAEGKPAITVSRFFVGARGQKALRLEESSASTAVGDVLTLGSANQTDSVLSRAPGGKAKAHQASVGFPANRSTINSADLAKALRTALETEEAHSARVAKPGQALVAKPNSVAVLTKDGFVLEK